MKNAKGFTLIELVIVIAILGILSAVALPRFANVSTNAKDSARAGALAALNSGIAIAKAKYVAQGSIGTVTLEGAAGALTVTTAGLDAATTCANAVAGLLQSSTGITVPSGSFPCTLVNSNWSSNIILSATDAS